MDEPDPVAIHDQAAADAKQKARVIAAYYLQLKAEGVDDYDAMKLTLAFQRRFLFPGQGPEWENDDE